MFACVFFGFIRYRQIMPAENHFRTAKSGFFLDAAFVNHERAF